MQAEYRYPWEKFKRVNRRHPCVICGHDSYCGYNSHIASCMREDNGAYSQVKMKDGGIAYLHWLAAPQRGIERKSHAAPVPLTTVLPAALEMRDRIYRDFLNMLRLNPIHRQELLTRGLSEKSITEGGYKSVPEKEAPWSICKRLMEHGHELSGIPGFHCADGKNGKQYWTFLNRPAYFIPVTDNKGRIQALQRHMNDSSNGKYKLFSCAGLQGGCSAGSPAHVVRPTQLKDGRVWITEGPLKANIASAYTGAIFIGALSAGTWRPAMDELAEIGTKEVVLAYDRDYLKNRFVKMAMTAMTVELKKKNIRISLASWDEREKGIDDALVKGMEIRIFPI